MSETEIYTIEDDGTVRYYGGGHNAHGGAMHVWNTLSEKYLGRGFLFIDPKSLWGMLGAGRLTEEEDVLLSFTFDYSWCRREDLPRLINALEVFWQHHNTFRSSEGVDLPVAPTIRELADHLTALVASPNSFRGVCFNQTSVNDNPWRVHRSLAELQAKDATVTEEQYQSGDLYESEYVPYNFDNDQLVNGKRPPWNIFDGLEMVRSKHNGNPS